MKKTKNYMKTERLEPRIRDILGVVMILLLLFLVVYTHTYSLEKKMYLDTYNNLAKQYGSYNPITQTYQKDNLIVSGIERIDIPFGAVETFKELK